MDPNQQITQQTQEDRQLERSYKLQLWRERIYRFFYNIWPGVSSFLAGFFYHLMRIIRGFFRMAMDEIRHGG